MRGSAQPALRDHLDNGRDVLLVSVRVRSLADSEVQAGCEVTLQPPVIAFTVHNRPHYLAETFESWSKVRGAEDAVAIFCCEPGCPEAVSMCRYSSPFGEHDVWVNEQKLGALSNPHRALETAFAQLALLRGREDASDFVILAEEDSPVRADVIEYFGWAAATYASDPEIMGVCAFQRYGTGAGPSAVHRLEWFSATVWGTWRDRWEVIGPDWVHSYDDDRGYPERGWDWHLSRYWVQRMGFRFIHPAESRSQVSGREGGTHLTPEMFEAHLSDCFAPDMPPQSYFEVRSSG